MALAVVGEADQAATVGTEHTLDTETASKTYVLVVDCGAMVNGDIVELAIKVKVRTGGTQRVAYRRTYAHAQAEPAKFSVPVPSNVEFVATLKQTAGTGRTFPWKLFTLD